jgi:F-type H+-transporting ATPase subunit b
MTLFLALAESIQLVPDGTLFLHIVIIIAMVFILNRALYRPISKVLSERDRHTKGSSIEAQGIMQRVDENLTNYERTLREARAESYRMLEEQRAQAVRERQNKLNLVREEVDQSVGHEKSVIQAHVAEARTTLESEARQMAAGIRDHILGRRIA